MDIPATLRLLLFIGVAFSVDPLRCHVSQSSSHYNSGVGSVCEGGHKESSYRTAATSLLLPMVSVLVNWIPVVSRMNGSTIQSKRNPCLTVQV